MNIYILSTALRGETKGLPEAAFKTKKAMMEYIRTEYADAKGTNRMEKNELYWEHDTGWINAERIPLL